MAHMGDLARFSLAAIGRAPHLPVVLIPNRVAGIPEMGCNSCIGGVFNHIPESSSFDFPSDFSPELEIDPLVIDGPASVCA